MAPTTRPFGGGVGHIAWKLQNDLPDFKEGDLMVLTYAIEVEDNYPGPDGPHRVRSGNRSISIVGIQEYRQYMLERLKQLLDDIREVHGDEQKSLTEVKTIKEAPVDLPQTQPAAPATQPREAP